jgi:ubiquitin-conjugating enzyme (huntingtin interacting protein 2)
MALISLRMLLESPNPKDPQDAQVAAMLLETPEKFAVMAHDWAVTYAGAPKQAEPAGKYKGQGESAPKTQTDSNEYVIYLSLLGNSFALVC